MLSNEQIHEINKSKTGKALTTLLIGFISFLGAVGLCAGIFGFFLFIVRITFDFLVGKL